MRLCMSSLDLDQVPPIRLKYTGQESCWHDMEQLMFRGKHPKIYSALVARSKSDFIAEERP